MRCKNCGLEIYVKNYKKKKKVDNKKINKYTKKVDKYDASVTGRKKQDITPDIVFDGICYIGAGNARVLDAVTSEIEMQPWQVTEVRRNLVDLGHIDVYLDLEHRTFKSWSCAPPALVITESGNAFLSGFRHGEMIENLLQGLAENHIEVDIIEQELAPSACIINNYIPSIEPVINGIVDPHGRKIKIVKEPAISILSSMPLMKNFKEFMKVIHVEDDNDVEKFDLQSGRFIKSGISGAGAYRTFLQGRCYFFHGEDGTSYKGDYNSVKVLAARENRTMLHGYNKNTSSFECVLGCEPPGLYKRALISCSGLLPKISDGKVTYKNVPEAIAGHILYRLYS